MMFIAAMMSDDLLTSFFVTKETSKQIIGHQLLDSKLASKNMSDFYSMLYRRLTGWSLPESF